MTNFKLACINLGVYDKIFPSKHLTLVTKCYFSFYIYNAIEPKPVQTYAIQTKRKSK